MVESYIRPLYDKLLINPLAKALNNFGDYHPLVLTVIGCISGITAAFFVATNFPLTASLLLLLSGYMDSLDGAYARLSQQTSATGAVLDIMSDRVVEFSIVLGLFLYHPQTRGLLAILMLGGMFVCISSFLIVGIFSDNDTYKSFHYSPGIIERPEAFALFIAMILLPQWFTVFASIFTGLILLTAGMRIWQFCRVK